MNWVALMERRLRDSDEIKAVDVLVEIGRIDPADLNPEAGDGRRLVDVLYGDPAVVRQELAQIASACDAMGLHRGDRVCHPRRTGSHPSLADDSWATWSWRRPAQPQLDLFFDAGSTRSANQFADALADGDVRAARAGLDALEQADPNHALVRHGPILLDGLTAAASAPAQMDVIERCAAAAPLALDGRARRYCERLWRLTANNSPELSTRSAALARIPDWRGVLETLGDPRRDLPVELIARASRAALAEREHALAAQWLAAACWSGHGGSDALDEFLWTAPFTDHTDAWFEADQTEWHAYPAWLRLRGMRFQAPADAPPPSCFVAAAAVADDDCVTTRRQLKEAAPTLFALWMRCVVGGA